MPHVAKELYTTRLSEWRRLLGEHGYHASISYGYPSTTGSGTRGHSVIRHLTGFTPRFGSALLVVSRDGKSWLIVPTGHDREYARTAFPWIDHVESAPLTDGMQAALTWIAGSTPIALTGSKEAPSSFWAALKQCSATSFDDTAAESLLIKDEFAIDQHRCAAAVSDSMIDAFKKALGATPRQSLDSMMADIEHVGRAQGAEIAACWLATGRNGRPSYRLEELAGQYVEPGDKALIGTYVTFGGYWAHSLRTDFAPGAASEASMTALNMAVEQHATASEAIAPGGNALEITRRSLDWIRKSKGASLGRYCFRQGHFMGLEYAEPASESAFPQSEVWYSIQADRGSLPGKLLEPGMVLELHTNFEHEDLGLIVLGDVYQVTERGRRRLTTVPQILSDFNTPTR